MNKCYVVMGVTGCGKTTIGKLLAQRMDIPFLDADDFHPEANIQKMSSGVPLTDADRLPWLQTLARELAEHKEGCVLGCSALKESYRKILESGNADITWIYLEATPALIRKRLELRKGHFMPAALIDSQFAALEIPANAIRVNAALPADEIIEEVVSNRD